jgi:hypothetical protein
MEIAWALQMGRSCSFWDPGIPRSQTAWENIVQFDLMDKRKMRFDRAFARNDQRLPEFTRVKSNCMKKSGRDLQIESCGD